MIDVSDATFRIIKINIKKQINALKYVVTNDDRHGERWQWAIKRERTKKKKLIVDFNDLTINNL